MTYLEFVFSSSIKVPAELAVDLRSKLAISLAHKSLVEPVKVSTKYPCITLSVL